LVIHKLFISFVFTFCIGVSCRLYKTAVIQNENLFEVIFISLGRRNLSIIRSPDFQTKFLGFNNLESI